MQRSIFKIANFFVLLLLFAHLYNNRHGLPIPVIDEQSKELTELMATYQIHYVGDTHTLNETIWGYDLTWALFVIFVFSANAIALRFRPKRVKTLKSMSLANMVLWIGAAITAFVFWSVPQQAIFSILGVTFSLSYLFAPKKPTQNLSRVAIIGGGIAGLTAAYQLRKKGYHNVTVFEKEEKVGGKCLSFEYKHDFFDMGGHEMLGDYTDVLEMADELGAESKTTIPPLIYDSKHKKYLNFKESVSISGYSKGKVMIACVRYWWMSKFKFRKFARPHLGFENMPEELMQPLGTWLKQKKLQPLQSIVDFVIKVQGYGEFDDTAAAYFVKFMSPNNWSSLILSGMGLTHKWPRVFVDGMQNFCERVALNTTVITSCTVKKVIRATNSAEGVIQLWTSDSEKMQLFDKLIVACPLNPNIISFLDTNDEENQLFSKIENIPFASTAARVEGLPAGVVATIPTNDLSKGEYTGYIKDYEVDDMAIFFSIAENGMDGKEITNQIKKVLKDIPPYKGVTPQLLDVHKQKIWQYFPHVKPQELKNGFYKKLENLQGKNNTFFVGSLFSFEVVGNTAAYSKELVKKHF